MKPKRLIVCKKVNNYLIGYAGGKNNYLVMYSVRYTTYCDLILMNYFHEQSTGEERNLVVILSEEDNRV